jgi:hypothetical protein
MCPESQETKTFKIGKRVQIFDILRDVSISTVIWLIRWVHIVLLSIDAQVQFSNEWT